MKAIKGLSRILIFSLAAAFLVAASMFSLALTGGTPVIPETFYGTLAIDQNPAPAGTHIKGYVGAEDRTFEPYDTGFAGLYGSQTFEGKFGVLCDTGEMISFMVEISPGNFVAADQTIECLAGAVDTHLDLTVTTVQGPVCGNGILEAGELCESPFGPCCNTQTCQFVQGTECRASSGVCDVAESCTGQSAACPSDAVQPNTHVCRQASGQCDVEEKCDGIVKSCPADAKAPSNTSCDDGLFCSATDHCDGNGNCIQLTARDCSGSNIAGIATCTNIPDSNPFTWDFRQAFTSVCNEGTDSCTAGSQTITHACSKANCSAACETVADCNDGNSSTVDSCLANCSCQHTYLPSCGNGNVDLGETCELPNTSDNPFCGQSTTQCSGTKLGVRDALGDCSINCGCVQDSFSYSCVKEQCGAECSENADCDDQDPNTIDTCLGDCTCQNIEQGEYCLFITSMKVLNSTFDEDYTIPAGTMYNIEMITYNNCDVPVSSMQIVQVLKGAMPVNLGTVLSTIQPADTSEITVGFMMPPGTLPGTGFTAMGFNWNHWIDQSPGTFQILSDTSEVAFVSE